MTNDRPNDAAIAVVGMSCRFPGARDTAGFLANLRAGVDSISRFSRDELVAAGVSPALARRADYVPARGVLPGGEFFDQRFFGYSPAEAAGIDPQQRVFLEGVSAALDDAGIDPHRFAGLIGVYAGCDLASLRADGDAGDVAARVIGQEKDFLATRVAYKLGLRGPAVTVQTACSTSLVAVHQACQSLLGYECDAALAGGVSLWLPQALGYLYQEGHILSPEGRCRPFDAAARGTVASSGSGIVVLRRLEDALRDRDRIVAVIRGSAINNDGAEKVGYTAPAIAGQRDVIRMALAQADVDPADVGYVEAHGTGTPVGDPVEVAALAAAFRESTDRTGYCRLGAVKGNIGHTGAAAGVAGLIKTCLMLRHREFVPTAHFERPNPELRLDDTPFTVAAAHEPWPAGAPPLAGVSSFGIGGTNAHAVLERAPDPDRAAPRSRPRVFCLSAASPEALGTLRAEVAEQLSRDESLRDDDVAWTLATGRRQFAHRIARVAADATEAVDALQTGAPGVAESGPRVAFLFPGQGALRQGIGRAAHGLLPEFRAAFDACGDIAAERFDIDLSDLLRPDGDERWTRSTEHQQLGLFALGYALAAQFRTWGITPAAMLGNSVGEYVAAAVAGVWDLPDALTLVRERGRAMEAAPPGRMLIVEAPPGETSESLAGELLAGDTSLTLAVQAPDHVVLSGDPEHIQAVHAHQQGRGVSSRLVDTERAFHSPLMVPAGQALRRAAEAAPSTRPRLPFVSNVTGTWADQDLVRDPGYWVEHLTGTVQLAAGAGTVLAAGCTVFVELGPGGATLRTVRRHPDWDQEWLAVPTLGRTPEREEHHLLTSLGRLWERGVDVGWDALFAGEEPRRCELPPHPFQPSRCERPRRVPTGPTGQTGPTGLAVAQAGAGPARSAVVTPRWSEVPVRREPVHDAVLLVGAEPDAGLRTLVAGLAGDGSGDRFGPAAPPVPLAADRLGRAADELSALGATAPAVVVVLPDEPDADLPSRLDLLAARTDKLGTALVVVGRRLADVFGGERTCAQASALTAWAVRRGQAGAPGSVHLLDIGPDGCPELPPAPAAGTPLYAWRGRRWWALAPQPVPVTPDDRPSERRFALLTSDRRDGSRLAADLAEHGLRVAAFTDAGAAGPAAPSPAQIADEVGWHPSPARLSQRPDLGARLNSYAAGLIGRFVFERAGLQPGERIDAGALRGRVDPDGRLPGLVDFFVRELTAEQLLRPRGDGFEVAADSAPRIAAALTQGDGLGEARGLRRVLDDIADAYPQVFSGEREAVAVLWPDGDETELRKCLLDNDVDLYDGEACLRTLAEVVSTVHARRDGAPLRILEVGAGHGGFTWPLLEGWPNRDQVEYHFTDISTLLVRKARVRAQELGMSGMRFSTFDITRDPAEQGLAAGSFDLVIAYNVLHVAPSIRASLGNLTRLLGDQGSLCLVEVTEIPRWSHMLWGLAPGWWGFDDDLRDSSINLDLDTWIRVLGEAGLGDVVSLPSGSRSADHHLMLATTPPGPAEPTERIAAELRRQAGPEPVHGVVYLPGPESADEPDGAGTRWERLRRSAGCGEVPDAFVVSEDPTTAGGWLAQERRRLLDPPQDGSAGSWRHLEVPVIGDQELAVLPRLLGWPGLPPVARLADAAALAPTDSPRGAPAGEVVRAPAAAPAVPVTTAEDGDPLVRSIAAIWCEELGLATVSDADDFFAQGGESLAAVHFLNRVRDQVGVRIAMPVFTESASFGRLVQLVRHELPAGAAAGTGAGPAARANRPTAAGPNLLTLRDTGSKRPLFLMAPAAGSSLCYRHVVAQLDPDQPVYGIESPGLHDAARPLRRLEDLAAHHIGVLRRVQPEGPYLLGGWSFGAMVSHEMARQLHGAGAAVAAVISFDGFLPDTHGWPVATRPGYLGRSLWFQLQARLGGLRLPAGAAGIPESSRRPGGLEGPAGRVSRIMEVNRVAGRRRQGEPDYVGVHNASITAMLRYVPRPAPCSMVLFKTALTATVRRRLAEGLPRLYTGGVEVVPAPGDHWTVLDVSQATHLGPELRRVLARLDSTVPASS